MSDTSIRPNTAYDLAGPQHAMLRPGVRVLRRDDEHLQVGFDRDSSVIVRDSPEMREMLAALSAGHPIKPLTPQAQRLWTELLTRGQLVDADSFFHQLPRALDGQQGRAALFANHPTDAPWRLAARRNARVHVEADHHGDEVKRLLEAAGIAVSDQQPSVAIVIVGGVVQRERLDALMQTNTPHLVISQTEGTITVGPFVEPGSTACLRCVDAHQSDQDPRHGLIVAQQTTPPAPSLVAEPYNDSHRLLAVALGIVDVVAYIDGDRPTSWSTTIDVGGADLPRTFWKRHPHCGCVWGEELPIG